MNETLEGTPDNDYLTFSEEFEGVVRALEGRDIIYAPEGGTGEHSMVGDDGVDRFVTNAHTTSVEGGSPTRDDAMRDAAVGIGVSPYVDTVYIPEAPEDELRITGVGLIFFSPSVLQGAEVEYAGEEVIFSLANGGTVIIEDYNSAESDYVPLIAVAESALYMAGDNVYPADIPISVELNIDREANEVIEITAEGIQSAIATHGTNRDAYLEENTEVLDGVTFSYNFVEAGRHLSPENYQPVFDADPDVPGRT